jgi:hypothetical protein
VSRVAGGDVASSAIPPQLEVPAFCVGGAAAARRRLRAIATACAECYRATGGLAALDVVPLVPGSLVFTDPTGDISARPGARIYLVPELLDEIQHVLGWLDSESVRAAFEASIRDACWGALAVAVTHRGPDTIESVRSRIESLARCWDALDPLDYVDFEPSPVTLSRLIQSRFEGLIAMWSSEPGEDVRRSLHVALEALEAADVATRLERAAQRLANLAAADPRIRSKAELTDTSFLRDELAGLDAAERESIEAGSTADALTFLIGTDRLLQESR